MKERPNYELFENNCQNFVTFLVDVLCPGAVIPETFQRILERLRDLVTVTTNNIRSLPGAYPLSNTSISLSVTSSESWITASDETWITAIEYLSVGGPESRTTKSIEQRSEPAVRRKLVAVGDRDCGKTARLTYVLYISY